MGSLIYLTLIIDAVKANKPVVANLDQCQEGNRVVTFKVDGETTQFCVDEGYGVFINQVGRPIHFELDDYTGSRAVGLAKDLVKY